MPLVLLVILALVQVAVIARDRMAVELAAREGARAASVSADPARAAAMAVDRVTSFDAVDVAVSQGADTVTVPRHNGHFTRASATNRARRLAEEEGVVVSGDPNIHVRRSFPPLIGPRKAYTITVTDATRVGEH